MNNFILYWMQQSQRVRYNKALDYAVRLSNKIKLPLIVCFNVSDFPEARFQHYQFMIDGIRQTKIELEKLGIGFIVKKGSMIENITRLADHAKYLVMDRGYLRIQRMWRKKIIADLKCDFSIIDADTIIPVTVTSDKQELAARTIRHKIKKLLPDHLIFPEDTKPQIKSLDHEILKLDESHLVFGKYPPSIGSFKGGTSSAQKKLEYFIENKLNQYHLKSNDPSLEISSQLSPYLHFGQISSLDIARQIIASPATKEAKDAYLEQLIVRRELAVNFVWFNPDYDKYESAIPQWAQKSLAEHRNDKRPFTYSYEALENAVTHDLYWNAAQNEMLKTGFMHNYMRMYWAKKIIEWTSDPETAYHHALKLNNYYQLDGRDPNSFTGVAWTFGLHDHPWKERDIFGKVRYMNAKGLERKFKIKDYADKWNTPNR